MKSAAAASRHAASTCHAPQGQVAVNRFQSTRPRARHTRAASRDGRQGASATRTKVHHCATQRAHPLLEAPTSIPGRLRGWRGRGPAMRRRGAVGGEWWCRPAAPCADSDRCSANGRRSLHVLTPHVLLLLKYSVSIRKNVPNRVHK